ncbi:hypothetical protein [Duncaniella muris]|uniref:hypothetical protein n=1 Tax=Duncaniella muris TaxID=2094150 RepID=UPI001434B7F8|nr:hypothetical protein [Duncaniella muris]GFI53088.1 hypothetical protein IMSAGC021_01398 [Muribaculaceae bacterium]
MQAYKNKTFPTDAKKLRDYMFNLRYFDYFNVRAKIVEACMIPPYTFANWLGGRTRIPELAKQKINEVIGKQIF